MSDAEDEDNVFEDEEDDKESGRKRVRLDSEDEDEDGEGEEDDGDDEGEGRGGEDDEDEEGENEDEEVEQQNTKKGKKTKPAPKREAKKTKRDYRRFILDEAAVADDDEDEDDDEYELDERGKPVDREILDAELAEANMLVERRHEANRAFQQASAAELAKQYQEKYRSQGGYRASGFRGRGEIQESELLTNDVAKQSLIPGVNDPGIWRIKVTPGSEKQLIRSILWKTMSRQREGKPVLIKSVFCTPTAGYIYIEAIEEPLAREAIAGLSGIYYSTLKRVPLAEMTTLLTFNVRAKPVKEGQWCRMRRGPLKGDLVKIVRLVEGEDGGTRALIQAIPRPDYDNTTKGKATNATSRPLQRMFVPEDAKAKGHVVERRRGFDNEWFDFWNGDLYKHGFLFKEVKVETYLNTADAAPKIHELTMFREKSKQDEEVDSDDDDDVAVANAGKQTSFMVELARQLEIEDSTKTGVGKVVPFRTGDVVQVTDGEFRNLRGTIITINEASHQVTLRPIHTEDLGNITVETSLLVKYIRPGAHIKVVNGTHLGQTGRVVSVHKVDGDLIAAILADGTNTEFSANVSHLQVSNEITSGLNSLGGYELYDLVMLSANEYAVVIFVGTDFLRVLTQHDIEKNVRPVEIKGKKSAVRGASGAFDHMKNPLCVGDSVSVVEGVHAKKTGTVKHINRSVLWLHSNTYLKNSGIFVVKGKSCLLAGGQVKDASSATTAAVINATYGGMNNAANTQFARGGGAGGGGGGGAFSKRGSKDPMIGKSVTITRGSYKGMLAHVVDVTDTQYSLELHGRLKKITIDKNQTIVVGDKEGAIDGEGRHVQDGIEGWMGIPSTPALTAQTPLHLAETPLYMTGNETPLHGSVSTPSRPDTPGRDADTYGYDVWKPNALDSMPPPSAQSNTSGWGGSDWRSPDMNSNTEPSGWGNVTSSNYENKSTTSSSSGWGQPEPTGWGKQPEPTGWGKQPEPTGWGKQPEPTGWGKQPEPTGWGKQPEPTGWGKQPEPTGWGNVSSKSVYEAPPEPIGWGHVSTVSSNSNYSNNRPPRASYYEDPNPKGSESVEVFGWNGPSSEWEPGMLVCFTSTKYIGQEGVLDSRLNQDGTFHVRVRDEMKTRVPNVSSSQLRLVEPKKKSIVKVMSGSKRGVVGKVKAIEGNDIMVEISSRDDIQVFRLSQVVRVDEDYGYGNNSSYGRR